MKMSDTGNKGHRQRLRDRFADGEESSRSEEALLELLLTYAIAQKDVQPLAAHLLSEYGSLSSLLETPIGMLCQSDGIKENSAVLLKLVDWIRRHHGPKRPGRDTLKSRTQTTLFETISPEEEQTPSAVAEPHRERVARRYGTEMFGKAMLREAIQILPNLPDSESLDEIRAFLRAELHFSAEQTRQRNANTLRAGCSQRDMRMPCACSPGLSQTPRNCGCLFLSFSPYGTARGRDHRRPSIPVLARAD